MTNIIEKSKQKFTEDDLDYCWPGYKTYLLEILNNEYDIKEAVDDLRSLIGSKWDARCDTNQ